jgi:hypothetical protein
LGLENQLIPTYLEDLMIIFTKVFNKVTNIVITIAEEIRLKEQEYSSIKFVRALWKKGF